MKETTADFHSRGNKAYQEFSQNLEERLGELDIVKLQERFKHTLQDVEADSKKMLKEVKTSHNHYKAKQKELFIGIVSMLMIFMLFALVMTIGNGFMEFLRVDILLNVIAQKIERAEGLVVALWYVAYGLPYFIVLGFSIWMFYKVKENIFWNNY